MIVTFPGFSPDASPVALMLATFVSEELQLAEAVRSVVFPLVNMPVAVNGCVLLTRIPALAGVTEIELITGAVTVRLVEPLLFPDLPETVVVPWPMVFANPDGRIVATPLFAGTLQITAFVTSASAVPVNDPVAANGCGVPSGTLGFCG